MLSLLLCMMSQGLAIASPSPTDPALLDVRHIVYRGDPFAASDAADNAGRAAQPQEAGQTEFFVEREVINADGSFPFGEGFLYQASAPAILAQPGSGRPVAVWTASHAGTKREQQDAVSGLQLRAAGYESAIVAVADGVSASGPMAAPAARTAIMVLTSHLERALVDTPVPETERHAFVGATLEAAAFAANLAVIRRVLLEGSAFPADPAHIEAMVQERDRAGRSALATIAVAVVVDNDLYTFNTGDAVIALFRATRPAGRRYIHLTDRDQKVVELFRQGGDPGAHTDVFQNQLTACLGASVVLRGTLRRYPDLLEPGDRLVASSDGLGPRGDGGLDRRSVEDVLSHAERPDAASALIRGQLAGMRADTYQDNIGVAVVQIE